jgi:hypothetical protein
MSAVKIIFKRSSVLGKRPTSANLEAGEIGLNTNPTDPGLFFETNNGSVVKVGPTAYLPNAPSISPARGELWVDSDTKALNIGSEQNKWQTVAAPFLGGTNGYTVFVAPQYTNSTDSLKNDGQTVPFLTINRAILEVSKQIILDYIRGIATGNNRYLIYLVPGTHTVINSPGATVSNFDVSFPTETEEVTQADLAQFNPVDGGLVLPRGVSIIGMDLKKCEIHPTYVPKYTHPLFPQAYRQQSASGTLPAGPIYENEPLSAVFKWTGNTYLSNFTCLDKLANRTVISVTTNSSGNVVLTTEGPHGLNFNDFIQVSYSNSADQAGSTFSNGYYYADPINTNSFILYNANIEGTGSSPIPATDFPPSYLVANAPESAKFIVSNVYPYFIPPDGSSYELSNYSHHRLSVVKNLALTDLNDFYQKVQAAFPSTFGGRIVKEIVTLPEYEIVAPATFQYPANTTSNSVDNTSPYENMVNHRSNYGMANLDAEGDIVSGFRSVIVNSSTAVVLQKDPVAYEVYSNENNVQQWLTLTEFVRQSTYPSRPITQIPTQPQLQALNEASIPNIRYYYETVKVLNPSTSELQSIGVSDINNDFRHFGFRVRGSNAFMQAQSTYTIGAAIGCWARDGATMSLTNATTNFGSVAFQADGFAGIGTLGGANEINKGFLQTGIVRPLALLNPEVQSDDQKRILYLGSRVVYVDVDPEDPTVQLIYLRSAFDPASILPYSLKPGSALFLSDNICTYRAFFVTDGTETVITSEDDPAKNPYSRGGAILRVRVSDSTIPSGPADSLEVPYIRRYIDPRNPADRAYGFFVQSTNPTSQAPQLGSVLRLNQTGQSLSSTLKRNYQFDPGFYGGTAQVFSVDYVQTEQYSYSPNYNNKISDAAQSTNYAIYASLSDSSTPWVQSIYNPSTGLTPFFTQKGEYITYENKNYFAAENDLWTSLYYKTNFTPINGPTKSSPDDPTSPYVITSVMQKQEPVSTSWQGYVPDSFYNYYSGTGVPEQYRLPADYKAQLTYMRGSVVPYQDFATDYLIDLDDSSEGLGIIYQRLADPASSTVTVKDSIQVQAAVQMTTPFVANPQRGCPEVIQLSLLSVRQIPNPKQKVSVVKLTYTDIVLHPELANVVEYARVIAMTSNTIQVIRDYYPEYSSGTLPAVWPKGTTVTACVDAETPEPSVYDPDWSVTKRTVIRYYQLMGYSPNDITPLLIPQYSGDRVLLNANILLNPQNGYANVTAPWPIEFNNPSTVYANTHTWQFVGYLDYSRGLPKYQVNQLPRKLNFDFISTTTYGGKLLTLGSLDTDNLIFLGTIRQGLTGNIYQAETPYFNSYNRLVYNSPQEVPFPSPILVYSADDISGSFDGLSSVFPLERGGYPIPPSQISTSSVFVFVGGVLQIPYDGGSTSSSSYEIINTGAPGASPEIYFFEAPPEGTSCDIRVVTSDDDSNTLEVVNFSLDPNFDGVQSTFTISPNIPQLTNQNSFVFLGGVEQNPEGINQTSGAYTIAENLTQLELNFIGGAPLEDTTINMRGILSGQTYRNSGVSSVYVTSVDDIAPEFDGVTKTFALTIDGVNLDPTLVNAENMFVSLGGVMQIPTASEGDPLAGLAYVVDVNALSKVLSITFSVAPSAGTVCNIRIVTASEFLTCPLPNGIANPELKVGPGITINQENQILQIDSGLVG